MSAAACQRRTVIRRTSSVCPVCLRPLPAALTRGGGGAVFMEKACPEHGTFRVPVWRGLEDMEQWRGRLPEPDLEEELSCPDCRGICEKHRQGTCCVLLEVTRRCDLRCRFCFASGELPEPGMDELRSAVDVILDRGRRPLIQFSGGEPSLRDDLPELVAYAKERGAPYLQLNSNGLRLASDEGYVRALKQAGLSFVFMQFDGTDDGVYEKLRGRPLLSVKMRAIELCDRYNIGVTLVPTVVRGVNDGQLGDIVRLAASLSPAVRGVHFQPVSFFGRYPAAPEDDDRCTLDELLCAVCAQAGIAPENLLPSRCDHPLCGFHGSFLALDGGRLIPLSLRQAGESCCAPTTAEQNREYVGRRWQRGAEPEQDNSCCCGDSDPNSLDGFLKNARTRGFTITAMAFQDAMNLDIERLRRCSLHVYRDGALAPFCARYLTPMELS